MGFKGMVVHLVLFGILVSACSEPAETIPCTTESRHAFVLSMQEYVNQAETESGEVKEILLEIKNIRKQVEKEPLPDCESARQYKELTLAYFDVWIEMSEFIISGIREEDALRVGWLAEATGLIVEQWKQVEDGDDLLNAEFEFPVWPW